MSKTMGILLAIFFFFSAGVSYFVARKTKNSILPGIFEESKTQENVVDTCSNIAENYYAWKIPDTITVEVTKKKLTETSTTVFEIRLCLSTVENGIITEIPFPDEQAQWRRPDSLVLFKICGRDTAVIRADSLVVFDENILEGRKYSYYAMAYFKGSKALTSSVTEYMSYYKPWFLKANVSMFAGSLVFASLLVFFIVSAGRGKNFFIRKLSGIDAVDEAIGRATEMGKDVLFIPGIMDMDDVQTIAGMIILGRVAKKVANYESKLSVPSIAPVAYNTAKEIVRQAYIQEGKPDSYDENSVFYLTGDQFGYAAAVDGIMVREKPATVFLMGHFYAESLILAETGHSIGAIQISGTADPSQLPFFVAACDYTLIGEEFFAASAYLSDDPRLVGSLKAQDFGKAAAIIALILGSILSSFGIDFVKNIFFTG
ncbi:hypothetical protein JXA84_01660 [candidate division WOR-3 bacterium]|nr:hypothetical protein [candidate division WOR-3 bacterium]